MKAFCEKCDCFREYETKEVDAVVIIRDTVYELKKLVGYCKECGQEVSTGEMTDENLRRLEIKLKNLPVLYQKQKTFRVFWGEIYQKRYKMYRK